jgi:hypothetical protein
MRRQSEALLLLPLLPIFFLGMFPMLLIGLLGYFSLVIFGILLVCVGFTSGLEAQSHFNREIIVRGYARAPERGARASDLHSTNRFAALVGVAGAALIIAGGSGLYFG